MKNFFLLHLLLACTNIFSQSTPQWLFPIWFEDANGDRDTVYIGYDPSAGISNTFDEEFEDYIWIDTSKFNVGVNFSISPYTGLSHPDSIKEIEITSSLFFNVYLNFIKGQMPITMYWDQGLFYSSDLPYPNLSPYPSAVAQVYCAAGEPGYTNCPSAFDDDPLTMTDSISVYYEFPISSPHLFDGSGVPPYNYPSVLESFIIDFGPYEIYNSITNNNLVSIKAYPNPFTNYINLHSDEIISVVSINNVFGSQIKAFYAINSDSFTLQTQDLEKGIYYLEVVAHKNTYTSIILKL